MTDRVEAWPATSGEMAERIRTFDWSATALGPVSGWPQSLRTAVELCLGSAFPSYIWWGPELIQIYNDAARPLVGRRHPHAFGQPVAATWPDVWAAIRPNIERVLRTGEPMFWADMPFHIEWQGQSDEVWYMLSYGPARDDAGRIAGLAVTAIETTARVNADRRLLTGLERTALSADFRALFDAAPSPYLVVAPPDFLVVAVNEAFLQMGRMERSALLGKRLFEIFPSASEGDRELAAAVRASIERVLATRRLDVMPIQRVELTNPADQGGGTVERWWNPMTAPVLDVHGEVALIIHRVEDVTGVAGGAWDTSGRDRLFADRQLAVAQVRDANAAVARATAAGALSEARYRTLFEAIDEGFTVIEVLFDAAGRAVDYRFLEANPAFQRHTGLPHPVGHTISELAPNHEASWAEIVGRVARTGVAERFEQFAAALNRTLEVYALRVGPPDACQVAALFTDVSERTRARERLRASERRQAFLVRLTDRLRGAANAETVQYEAARALGEHVGAARAGYAEEQPDGSVAVTRNYTNGVPGIEGRYQYDDYGPELVRTLRLGRSVIRPDIAHDPTLTPAEKSAHAVLQLGATLNVPLLRHGQLTAILFVHHSQAHAWTEEEVELAEEVAARTWDAVERACAEAVLRESESRYRALAELSPDAIFVHQDGRFVYANAATARLLGLASPDDLLGRSPYEFIDERYHAAIRERVLYMLDERRAVPVMPVLWNRVAGGQISISASAGPIEWQGAPAVLVLAHDVTEREAAAEALRRAHDELEQRVTARTAELAAANASLEREVRERRAAEERIKALFGRLVSIQEEERRRISRDIHDQLGQAMTALRMHLDALQAWAPSDPAMAERAARVQAIAEELDQSIDSLTWQLRPAVLDHLGLAASLRQLVEGWAERFHLEADFDGEDGESLTVAPDVAANLYRLTQEALHNVFKHAGASRVSVSLQRQRRHLILSIEDDGRGFDPHVVRHPDTGQLGLVSMRERAELVGGEVTFDSAPGRGTAVIVRVPIERRRVARHGTNLPTG